MTDKRESFHYIIENAFYYIIENIIEYRKIYISTTKGSQMSPILPYISI